MKNVCRRERELFEQAIDIASGEDREAFLRSQCGTNASLLREVRELVAWHFDDDFFVDELLDAATSLPVDMREERPGLQIGAYRLVEKIGEGGMGLVFLAEQQQPIRRQVALKIIRAGMDSEQVLARFEAERQTLERLEHPNVTRIYDAGVAPSGRPYFVMELIRGTSITQYCDQHRLPVAERLQMFVEVCRAIHHAHQKGIIHRDIKPSNVMVAVQDGAAVVKVIDFGIAKAIDRPLLERTRFTQCGDLLGTPEYMSPEQAEMNGLDLDARTDIYALGILLYQLLTGSTPLRNEEVPREGLLKVCETICNGEPEWPSTRLGRLGNELGDIAQRRATTPSLLRRRLHGELDWITMKALAKPRDARYDSAAALAKDVMRHLSGEPVEAAAPSLTYRAGKFMAKYRLVCTFSAFSILLLFMCTIVSAYWAVAATQANQLAHQRAARLGGQQAKLLNKARTELEHLQREMETLKRLAPRNASEPVSVPNAEADVTGHSPREHQHRTKMLAQ